MRFGLFLFHILLFVISANIYASDISKATKGVIDLRSIDNPDNFNINLNGEWEFYWNKLLHPHDFQTKKINPDYYGKVPSYWTSYPEDSIRTEKHGYATYRLSILLPPGVNRTLAFDMPVFDSSYDIYINGIYFGGNGIPGKTAYETEPGYSRNFFRYDPNSDTLTVIINVANFSHRRGGFWLPVQMGTFTEHLRKRKSYKRKWNT